MKIGTEWEIKSDSLNVTLLKRKLIKETEERHAHYSWIAMGYFSNIHNALKFLVDLGINETELKDLKTIVKKEDELYKLIGGIK